MHQVGETATLSIIDFTPDTKKVRRATTPQRQEATKIALTGLREVQNFALLVDAGFREAPDALYSATDRSMARTAQRLGFSSEKTGIDTYIVEAPFNTIHDVVFSPEAIAYGAMLSNRLATMNKR